jgi:ArsR family transcriptional regulator, arsenate/arsenite/antimonite-responsive transcriptional repressor
MELEHAVTALAALAQPTRLTIFRLLIEAGAAGIPAGQIAKQVEAPQNTVSSHLSTLAHAGLVVGMREGRMVRYRIDLDAMRDVLEYLVKDCCAGNPQICLPLLQGMDSVSAACTPATVQRRTDKDSGHDR